MRTADRRDTDVIDERAPSFSQAVRYCVPCLAYFELVQPRFGEGRLEDFRPPRPANIVGTAFLGAAALSWWLGAPRFGTVLGLLVAALALLAASTGFCAGCEIYRLSARLRGISPASPPDRRADLNGLSGGPAYVEFTHPLCSECRPSSQVRRRGRPDGAQGRAGRRRARPSGPWWAPMIAATCDAKRRFARKPALTSSTPPASNEAR